MAHRKIGPQKNCSYVNHQQFSLVFATLHNTKQFAQIPQKHLTLVAVCMCINVPKRKCNGVKLGVWIISSRHKKYVPYNDVKAPLHKAMLAWLLFVTYQISVFYMVWRYILDIIAASIYFWSVSLVYQLSGQCLIFLVDQIFFWYTKFFFGIPNFFLVDQILFLVDQISFWYTKYFFGRPNFFVVDQKNEKLTGQLVHQRDWPKVHGRRYKVRWTFA